VDTIPLSALQHWLYCPRQCALIHNEQVWAENRFTAEGQLLHKKANEGPDEHRAACSILRHLNVSSETLGITGICDIVEIQNSKSQISNLNSTQSVTPVEYKRGKPKAHRADEVQVCAQALCLEEMFQTQIPVALIFYGSTRRRTEVPLDDGLRALTLSTIAAVRQMKATGLTYSADYDSHRCDACSLIDLCQPRALRLKRGAASWFQSRLSSEATAAPSSFES
jgi:CRISPR-associated exonuclease Cas4